MTPAALSSIPSEPPPFVAELAAKVDVERRRAGDRETKIAPPNPLAEVDVNVEELMKLSLVLLPM